MPTGWRRSASRSKFFQNILMNGGVCGRRAFFGRFILRAYGVPTTARPQRGHAALAHWTPDGWVVCLGAGWGNGWTKTRYDKDLDFLATTQARATGEAFMQVKRAQWIGDVMGETRSFGFLSGDPALWNGLALYTQRAIIEDAKARTLAAVGEDIGEANETKEQVDIAKVSLTEADRTAVVGKHGVITIPASATSKPTESTGKIIFMNSNLGGRQLHYSRNGGHQEFEYTFDAPTAGRYALTARVVTPSWKQSLLLAVNDAKQPVEIALPFTVGMWDTTEPVEIELAKGTNVLRFTREGEVKGVTIKDFTLTPMRGRASRGPRTDDLPATRQVRGRLNEAALNPPRSEGRHESRGWPAQKRARTTQELARLRLATGTQSLVECGAHGVSQESPRVRKCSLPGRLWRGGLEWARLGAACGNPAARPA